MKYNLHYAFAVLLLLLSGCEEERIAEYRYVQGEGDSLPPLPSPFTPEETTALRTSFDWNATAPLAENDAEGRPAYYYALMLVGSREQADVLELARIYHDPLPLFPEEMGPWDDADSVMISFVGDDHGMFVYAFIPGVVYNEIRRGALANEPSFEAVILRTSPDPTVQHADGYLNIDVLVERGCTFGITDEEIASERAMSSGMTTSPLFGRVLRGVIRFGRLVANEVRAIAAGFRVKRDFSFRMRVVNSDPLFFDGSRVERTLDFNANILRRSWGASARVPIVPHGTEIIVRTNMSITSQYLSRSGEVTMSIPRDKEITLFMDLRNEAAIITAGSVWPRRAKLGRGDWGVHDRSKPLHIVEDIRDRDVHELALFTDARDFAVQQLHFHPRRAVVVDGVVDTTKRESSTACWSFFGFGTTAFGKGRGWSLVGIIPGRILADFDMVIRGNDGASRGIPVHEYGHFLMCNMFRDMSRRDFGRAYGEVIQDTVTSPSPKLGNEARLIAEGWADFYAAQVVGGTNYFATRGTRSSADVNYCDQTNFGRSTPCTEDNIGGPRGGGFPNASHAITDPAYVAIGTFTTLMVDAFDSTSPDSSQLSAAGRWEFIAPVVPPPFGTVAGVAIPTLGNALDDEVSALYGNDLMGIVERWSLESDRLRFTPFYNALALAIAGRHDRDVACRVFELHEPSSDCTAIAPVLGMVMRKSKRPVGLRVHSSLSASGTSPVAHANWAMLAPDATHAYVDVRDGTVTLAATVVPYALRGEWSSNVALPFDRLLNVRVAASLGVGADSEYSSGTVQTPAEPVHVATASTDAAWSATVRWTRTAATGYVVRSTNTSTGVTTWIQAGNANSITINELFANQVYRFDVFSINATGDVCPLASPSAYATPYAIVID